MEIVNRGKKLVIAQIVIILLIDIVVTVWLSSLYIISGRMDLASSRIWQGFIRFLLTGSVLYFMYKGHRWAKWLLAVLLILGGLSGLASLTSGFNLTLIAMSLVYGCIGIMMIFSKSINTFYLYQRGLYHLNVEENIHINDNDFNNLHE